MQGTLNGNRFDVALSGAGTALNRGRFEVLQINVGKLCNLTCRHCHVTAGPNRKELMSPEVASRVLEMLEEEPGFHTLDITGGAPEMAPVFRDLVIGGVALGRRVIDRCNLTILVEPGYEDLADFLAEHRVEIVASLPCYTPGNVDKQRGEGVFADSIRGLKILNDRGYGVEDGLRLDLVYNPGGPSLPPAQDSLERDYKTRLAEDFGIVFTNLITISNMPIGRFKTDLRAMGKLDDYMNLLERSFNPATVPGLMCRNHLSVDWRGFVYDCDFNQMLGLPLGGAEEINILDTGLDALRDRIVATGDHCLGCTAGAGSSCGGALV